MGVVNHPLARLQKDNHSKLHPSKPVIQRREGSSELETSQSPSPQHTPAARWTAGQAYHLDSGPPWRRPSPLWCSHLVQVGEPAKQEDRVDHSQEDCGRSWTLPARSSQPGPLFVFGRLSSRCIPVPTLGTNRCLKSAHQVLRSLILIRGLRCCSAFDTSDLCRDLFHSSSLIAPRRCMAVRTWPIWRCGDLAIP